MFNFQRSARTKGDKARKATQFVKQVAEYINTNHNSFTRISSKALHLVFVAALVAGLALSVAPVPVAHAATITVTTAADELNSDGDCSLREAIQAANTDAAVDACLAGSGAETITLPAGTYLLSIAGADEDGNATGDLDITTDLTINGAGAATTIIDGAGLDRVFGVLATVEISGLTIRNGSAIEGGGISNFGTLTLRESTVSGNSAFPSGGGGIANFSGTLTLRNSTVSDNVGGAAIRNLVGTTVTINDSTVSGNTFGILTFRVTLKNTIVANNTAADCSGSGRIIISAGHNLDSDNSCSLTAPGDLPGVNPLLGPLTDNGGPTQTHALLAGSPAINAGSSDCPPPATDQRGVTRPQGAACDIGAFEVETSGLFNFTGFFQPVDNLPTWNMVKAGQAIPVKFSLNGDQGLNIFAAGYPRSRDIPCDSTTVVDGIEVTVTAGSSSLSYDPSTDTYAYVWKTNKTWANTCRQLVVKLNDGTYHQANFKFK